MELNCLIWEWIAPVSVIIVTENKVMDTNTAVQRRQSESLQCYFKVLDLLVGEVAFEILDAEV